MQQVNKGRQIREGLSIVVSELEALIFEAKKQQNKTLVEYLEKCLKHAESAMEFSEVILLSMDEN